jgi:hypothetical protein
MGAWGVGHFDNDDAGDWLIDFEDAKSLTPVESIFDEVDASLDYLDAGIASMGLVAAEIVAAAAGNAASDLPDSTAEAVAGLTSRPDPELVARARVAVEKIGAESELRELWEETDDFGEWQSKVAGLVHRLS